MTTFGFKKRFMISSWNVRTLSEISRIEQVQKQMMRYNKDILGLSEVADSGSRQLSSGNLFLYCGNSKHRRNGGGLLLSPMAKAALIEFNPISERIITARFNSKFRKISIVQCYAPTEPDEDDVKDDFYNQLEAVTNSLHDADIKIFRGDFNAMVGTNNKNLQSVMGKHGLGASRNNNGDRLVDFCTRNRLFIGGTKFPHKDIHKYTWESPNGRSSNHIDPVFKNA